MDLIDEIYDTKQATDTKNMSLSLPLETVEEAVFSFFEKRFGIKALVVKEIETLIRSLAFYVCEERAWLMEQKKGAAQERGRGKERMRYMNSGGGVMDDEEDVDEEDGEGLRRRSGKGRSGEEDQNEPIDFLSLFDGIDVDGDLRLLIPSTSSFSSANFRSMCSATPSLLPLLNDTVVFFFIITNRISDNFYAVQRQLKQTVEAMLRKAMQQKMFGGRKGMMLEKKKMDEAIRKKMMGKKEWREKELETIEKEKGRAYAQQLREEEKKSRGQQRETVRDEEEYNVTEEEWKMIVGHMYNDEDTETLSSLIQAESSKLCQNKKKCVIPYSTFLTLLLNFQLLKNVKFIAPFRELFTAVTGKRSDKTSSSTSSPTMFIPVLSGAIHHAECGDLLRELFAATNRTAVSDETITRTLDEIDPSASLRLTFSQCVAAFSDEIIEYVSAQGST